MQKYYLFLLLSVNLVINLNSQMDFSLYSYWEKLQNPSNILYTQLHFIADEQLNLRREKIRSIKTEEDWKNRQKEIKESLSAIIGPFPARTPMHPSITGRIERESYSVEKILFQSRPGFYVTAALFIPKQINLPAPAILFCSGHTTEGFRSPTYQHMILNYVSKGFIVFAFDPIGQGERFQYFDQQGHTFFGTTQEHSYPGSQVFIAGCSLAGYFIWDAIRAIDYLVSRKEVDPRRIGVTGRSGGGTQTTYLLPFENRIAAAAPECYLTTYDMHMKLRGTEDAEQVIFHFLKEGLDLTDWIISAAPLPLLMVTTTRDIFSIQGARDLYAEANECYKSLGVEKNLQKVEFDTVHASTKSNREATYAFFQKYLDNPGSSKDIHVELFGEKDLWVTKSGNVIKELGSKSIFQLNKKEIDGIEAVKNSDKTSSEVEIFKDKVRALTGYVPLEREVESIYSGAHRFEEYRIEKYLLKGRQDYYLPLVWMKPRKGNGKRVLLLDDRGKQAQAIDSSLANQLVKAGHEVILPDLSGIGELSGGYGGGNSIFENVPINLWYMSVLTGKTAVAIRLEEIEILRRFIIEQTREHEIEIIGLGSLGSDLMHAGAMGIDFSSMTLIKPLCSYRSLATTMDYNIRFVMSAVPGSAQVYDLPQLLSFGTEKIHIINPVFADGRILSHGEATEHYPALTSSVQGGTCSLVSDEDLCQVAVDYISRME